MKRFVTISLVFLVGLSARSSLAQGQINRILEEGRTIFDHVHDEHVFAITLSPQGVAVISGPDSAWDSPVRNVTCYDYEHGRRWREDFHWNDWCIGTTSGLPEKAQFLVDGNTIPLNYSLGL